MEHREGDTARSVRMGVSGTVRNGQHRGVILCHDHRPDERNEANESRP